VNSGTSGLSCWVIVAEGYRFESTRFPHFLSNPKINSLTGMRIFREYPEIRVFSPISGVFQSGCSPFEKNKKIKICLVKMTPQFILSTLKCNSVTPKALKLHLQSIKLQKSFYSSNFCSFMCAVMLWYAKFQFFFVSTILILDVLTAYLEIILIKMSNFSPSTFKQKHVENEHVCSIVWTYWIFWENFRKCIPDNEQKLTVYQQKVILKSFPMNGHVSIFRQS
jgi:hypothetical protein